MRHNKKMLGVLLGVVLSASLFTGCGNNQNTDMNNAQSNENGTTSTEWMSPGEFGNMDVDDAGDTTQNKPSDADVGDNNEGNNTGNNTGDSVGDAVDDVADGVGNAVDDVADGVGDAIDNLGGGSFDAYEDARDYLLGKLQNDNAAASYEVREENQDLVSYNSNDSGAQGYQFSVYETDRNEKIGLYYVDKETGKIYRYMGKNSIEAY